MNKFRAGLRQVLKWQTLRFNKLTKDPKYSRGVQQSVLKMEQMKIRDQVLEENNSLIEILLVIDLHLTMHKIDMQKNKPLIIILALILVLIQLSRTIFSINYLKLNTNFRIMEQHSIMIIGGYNFIKMRNICPLSWN